MFKLMFLLVVSSMVSSFVSIIYCIPIDHNSDSVLSKMSLGDVSNIMMSPPSHTYHPTTYTPNYSDSLYPGVIVIDKGIDTQRVVGKKGVVIVKGVALKKGIMAKNGLVAKAVTRFVLKPIAILTGLHLKAIGSGLTFGGKMIGGTGVGIAKTGTIVKYVGLGSIGLGASAIGWGLDKSTIDSHIETHPKYSSYQ